LQLGAVFFDLEELQPVNRQATHPGLELRFTHVGGHHGGGQGQPTKHQQLFQFHDGYSIRSSKKSR
jgi:hypothetical protein